MAAAPTTVPGTCVASLPVGRFRLLVQPEKGGNPRPVRLINRLAAGQILRYEPLHIPASIQAKAEVAIVLAPPAGDLIALDPQPATSVAAWKIPGPAAVVTLIFGPRGLNVKKVKTLVGKNQEMLSQLADYAEQTEKLEALVDSVAASEATGRSLDAALAGFSAQYNVALPKLDTHASSDQQAGLLLKAVMPSLSAYDPLNPNATVQQSMSLATSLAGLFFGSPVGLAAGGASLFQNLRIAMFPETELRSAIMRSATDTMTLCAKNQPAKPHTRVAYLWAHRIPGLAAPESLIADAQHIPVGLSSKVKGAGLKGLERAYDWRLLAVNSRDSFPVAVSLAPDASTLALDLAQSKAPAGDYRLAASWDWDPFELKGIVHLHALGDFKSVRPAPSSCDRLVEASGRVAVELTGADFEFVDKVAIQKIKTEQDGEPLGLPFKLPQGPRAGEQRSLQVEIDTARLGRGAYRLLLTQSDQKTHEVPIAIHPPNPRFDNLPVRANLGDVQQPLALRGAGLDRVERITTGAGEVSRQGSGFVIRLRPEVHAGDEFPMQVKVEGIDEPITFAAAIVVAPPRPRIKSVRKSFGADAAANPGMLLRENELPAGTPVSFELAVEHADRDAAVDLSCGEKDVRIPPRIAGQGVLFFSADPGAIGQTGCHLAATVVTPAGTSDPMPLGDLVRVPRIEHFELTDEKLGDNAYAGIIQGQDLETIAKAGWDAATGLPVPSLPVPLGSESRRQSLKIAMPWPAPSPHAPLYIWLRGESTGRPTGVRY